MSQIDPKQIREDITYFMGKINFGASHLDARAVQIMNELFGIPALIEELEELKRQNEHYRSLIEVSNAEA